jgi:hypothetical protein
MKRFGISLLRPILRYLVALTNSPLRLRVGAKLRTRQLTDLQSDSVEERKGQVETHQTHQTRARGSEWRLV